MLTSSGGIFSVGPVKGYHPVQKRAIACGRAAEHCFDSVVVSAAMSGEEAFQMELVSRLSQEVRTATTTGDIQSLKQAVASGEYVPHPMEIAGKILYLAGE